LTDNFQTTDKLSVVIPAGGQGLRMGSKVAKQFIELKGKPIIHHTIAVFEALDWVDKIILCVPEEEVSQVQKEMANRAKVRVVVGGEKRQDSVYNGLKAIGKNSGFVAVHDGVRPFITEGIIKTVYEAAKKFGAAVAAIPVNDTLKRADGERLLQENVDRENLWRMQTPQIFKTELLLEAMEKAQSESFYGTDEGSLIHFIGKPVKFILGSEFNIKITRPEDLILGEWIASLDKLNTQ
jgi:2-C-methyl-D-erythritol 4-phosphate cytidylyltransferase